MIEARKLGRRFGEKRVLRGVDFTVPQSGFAVVTGANGSGKTTLLKLLARLHSPRAGAVRIGDRDIASYSRRELARLVAGVWQRPPLSFGFTARQIVLLGRTPYLSLLRWETAGDQSIVDARHRSAVRPARRREIRDALALQRLGQIRRLAARSRSRSPWPSFGGPGQTAA